MQEIRLVQNKQIDRKKWDFTIEQAQNSRIYAFSWYLDQVAPNWKGLILGDYKFVMPLAIGKKYGLKFIYQPTYAQQHGLFPNPSQEITNIFLERATKLAPYIIIGLNSENEGANDKFSYSKKPNYLLNLNQSYSDIQKNYSKSHKRYTNKAYKEVIIKENINIEEYLTLKRKSGDGFINERNITVLKSIALQAKQRNICNIIGAYHHDKLCAASLFIFTSHRALYLNAASSRKGLELRAMYAVVDYFIKKFANQNIKLDFEGSSIEGIATFFKRFGAKPEYYTVAKRNVIPFLKYFMK
jgi:hypothetical protein